MINNEPELEGDMRTVAQQWIDEGIQKGVVMGEQKGIEKGIEKVAQNMLNEVAQITFIAKTTGLTESQIKTIQSGNVLH